MSFGPKYTSIEKWTYRHIPGIRGRGCGLLVIVSPPLLRGDENLWTNGCREPHLLGKSSQDQLSLGLNMGGVSVKAPCPLSGMVVHPVHMGLDQDPTSQDRQDQEPTTSKFYICP